MRINPFWLAIILVLGLIISVLGYNFHTFLYELLAIEGFFYKCMALFILILIYLIYELSHNYKLLHYVSMVGIWLAGYNLMDELFFDPTKNSIWEWIMSVIVISFTIIKYNKNAK